MIEEPKQFDYPVRLDGEHVVYESSGYDRDKFKCHGSPAYTHTGAWPAFNYCPFCGGEL